MPLFILKKDESKKKKKKFLPKIHSHRIILRLLEFKISNTPVEGNISYLQFENFNNRQNCFQLKHNKKRIQMGFYGGSYIVWHC